MKTVKEVFKIDEICGLIYNERTGECRFFLKNKSANREKLIKGKLLMFNKESGELLVEKI